MVELQHIGVEGEDARTAALPYMVELWADDGAPTVVGQLRTASLAFACYYGALREYVGRRIVLRHGAQVLATYTPPQDGFPG